MGLIKCEEHGYAQIIKCCRHLISAEKHHLLIKGHLIRIGLKDIAQIKYAICDDCIKKIYALGEINYENFLKKEGGGNMCINCMVDFVNDITEDDLIIDKEIVDLLFE